MKWNSVAYSGLEWLEVTCSLPVFTTALHGRQA